MLRVFRSPLARRLAALVAAWGLLALPLRSLAACPMQDAPGAAAVVDAEQSEHAAHAEHAGHEMAADEMPAPADHDDRGHDVCPDVAHCAALELRDHGPVLPQGCIACGDRSCEASDRLSSVGRSLDTPPPKRA